MRQYEYTLTQFTRAKRHTARKDGDFWNLDGLHPTPDRQQLRRSPGFGSWTAWSQGFIAPSGAFYNAGLTDSAYYYFIGEDDDTGDLAAISYEGQGWNSAAAYSAINDLAITDTRLRGLFGRNHYLWYSQDLIYIADADEDVYKSANFGAGAQIYDGNANPDARMLVPHGDRLYLICETGEIWQSDDTIAAFTQIYDPAPFMDIRFAIATANYLLLFAHLEPGTIQLYNLPLPNAELLLPIDTLPDVPCNHPLVDMTRFHAMPWATNGEDVYFSSGHYPEFNNTRLDIYRYNGSRIQKEAEAYDLANPTSAVYAMGLTIWHGELLLWQIANGETWIRMLVGDRFVDFVDLSSTAPWNAAQDGYTALYNLAGSLWGLWQVRQRLWVHALQRIFRRTPGHLLARHGQTRPAEETQPLDGPRPRPLRRSHRHRQLPRRRRRILDLSQGPGQLRVHHRRQPGHRLLSFAGQSRNCRYQRHAPGRED